MSKPPDLLQDPTVRLTQELIRVPSVTPVDPKDLPQARQSLDIAAKVAALSGARATWLDFSGGHPKWGYKVENLYLEWEFGQAKKHLCYIGHLDVVPPGDASKWSDSPYSGAIKDGYIYGRGATDMKGSVAAFITAVQASLTDLQAATDGVKISMILTTDEEWAGINGSAKVLDWMKAQGQAPDAFIVGEPSSQDRLGSHLKTGRRGSLVGRLIANGTQGHAAYPDLFENPNRALALAISILNGKSWGDGTPHSPATNFEAIALQSGDPQASAIVPGTAEALWNIRFTARQTPDSLESWIKDTLANPPAWAKAHPDFHLLKTIEVKANKDTASWPYDSPPGTLAAAMSLAVQSVTGAAPVLDGSGGTTDGRFAARAFPAAQIVELGLPERGGLAAGQKPADYLARGGMHQVDERAALEDLVRLREIFGATLKNYANG